MARSPTLLSWSTDYPLIIKNELSAIAFNALLTVSICGDFYSNLPRSTMIDALFWLGSTSFALNHYSMNIRSIMGSQDRQYAENTLHHWLLDRFRAWLGLPAAVFHQLAFGKSLQLYLLEQGVIEKALWTYLIASVFIFFGSMFVIPMFSIELVEPQETPGSKKTWRLLLAIFCSICQSSAVGAFYLRAFLKAPQTLQLGKVINKDYLPALNYYCWFHTTVLVANLASTQSYVAGRFLGFYSKRYKRNVNRFKRPTAWAMISGLSLRGMIFYYALLFSGPVQDQVENIVKILSLLAISTASIWRFALSMFAKDNEVNELPAVRV